MYERILARRAPYFNLPALICLAALAALVPAPRCLAQFQSQEQAKKQSEIERFRAALDEAQSNLVRQQQSVQEQRAQLESQFEQARKRYEQQVQRMSQSTVVAPARHEYKVFRLQYLPAREAIVTLSEVLGGDAKSPRLSVDSRANSLIAAGTNDQLSTIEALLQNLDVAQAAVSQVAQSTSQTLQLRMIWVLDGPAADETANATKGLDSRVSAALAELGFEHPTIVCQPVATMVVGSETQGRFKLEIPVVIGGSLFTFSSSGQVDVERDDRFAVQWNARISQAGLQGNPNSIVGSVLTPLEHYTVLGTSMVVSTTAGDGPVFKQYRSAFVVNLTKADDRPVKSAEAAQLR